MDDKPVEAGEKELREEEKFAEDLVKEAKEQKKVKREKKAKHNSKDTTEEKEHLSSGHAHEKVEPHPEQSEHIVKKEEHHPEHATQKGENEAGLWESTGMWRFLAIILVVLFVASLFTGGFSFNSGIKGKLSQAEATTKVVNFVNAIQPGLGIVAETTSDEGDIYKITLRAGVQTIDSYITKDGRLLFPEGIDLSGANILPPQAGGANVPPSIRADVSADDDPVKGNANAPVTIIEFSDFECPFCARFYTDTLPQIEERYIKTGKVKLVYRDFPLENIHIEARPAAQAAECADEQGKFWEFHDKLFENQASLNAANYKKWAAELGLDTAKFNECVDTEKYAGEVSKDLADGSSAGVRGTPAFFVNGRFINGAEPFGTFEPIIEAELAAQLASGEVAEENTPASDEIVITADEPANEPLVVEGSGLRKVAIEAKKFRFTPNDIKVAKGTTVELQVKSVDVDFLFSLPALNIQLILKPGETSIAQFTAAKAGEYEFKCGKCNGKEVVMRGKIVVE